MARQSVVDCFLLSIIMEYFSSIPNCSVHYLWYPSGEFRHGDTVQIFVLSSHRISLDQLEEAHDRHVSGIHQISVPAGPQVNTPGRPSFS